MYIYIYVYIYIRLLPRHTEKSLTILEGSEHPSSPVPMDGPILKLVSWRMVEGQLKRNPKKNPQVWKMGCVLKWCIHVYTVDVPQKFAMSMTENDDKPVRSSKWFLGYSTKFSDMAQVRWWYDMAGNSRRQTIAMFMKSMLIHFCFRLLTI